MDKNVEEILFTRDEIEKRLQEMGAQISQDYAGQEIVVIGILKGVAYFMTNLTLNITVPTKIDFIRASSYGAGTESSGVVKKTWDVKEEIRGKNVILLDDIIDTGLTLLEIKRSLEEKCPKSLKVAVMLDKKERRKAAIEADYVGFDIPDKFVVGFGLDYDEMYRNLPYIGVLKPEVYEK